MTAPRITIRSPKGVAFEISDLVLLQDWTERHHGQMAIELDYSVEGEEYEEVVAYYAEDSELRSWMLWRSASNIIVLQPLIGRSRRYGSVADALESLTAHAGPTAHLPAVSSRSPIV